MIFLTKSEHTSLHNKNEKLSDETKRKIGESNKGKPSWNKGIAMSADSRRKLSNSLKGKPSWNKGKHLSTKTRKKLSNAHKGKKYGPHKKSTIAKMKQWHWYTNGIENIRAKECPKGFRCGRIR